MLNKIYIAWSIIFGFVPRPVLILRKSFLSMNTIRKKMMPDNGFFYIETGCTKPKIILQAMYILLKDVDHTINDYYKNQIRINIELWNELGILF